MRLRLRRLHLWHLHLRWRGSSFWLAHHLGSWLRLLDRSGRRPLVLRPILHRRFAPLRWWLGLGLHALRLLRVPDYWWRHSRHFDLTLLPTQRPLRLHLLTHALSLCWLSHGAFGALLLNLLLAKFGSRRSITATRPSR